MFQNRADFFFPPGFSFKEKLLSKMTDFCQTFHSWQIGIVIEESTRLGISEALQEPPSAFTELKSDGGELGERNVWGKD